MLTVTRTRNPVERQYGLWKRRFPILAVGLRSSLQNSMAVIVACAVLHNVALQQNEELPGVDAEVLPNGIEFDEEIGVEPPEEANYNNARDELLANYFPRLLRQE